MSKYQTFNIIRHYNSSNTAEYRGIVVHRREKIYIPEYGGEVLCAAYDDHFIFEVPKHIKDTSFRCTCGGAAIITGFAAYAHDASPSKTGGYMLICLNHATFGQHATGGSRWI